MPTQPQPDLLRTPEAATLCNVSSATISEWIRDGKLPARQLNGRHLIARADLIDLLNQQRKEMKL